MYFINILCYLGLAPEIWLLKTKNTQIDVNRHIENGLLLNLLFLFSVFLLVFIQILEYFLFYEKSLTELDNAIVNFLDTISFAQFLVWAGISFIGLVLALLNLSFSFPFTEKLFRSKPLKVFTLAVLIAAQVTTLITVGITLRANHLVRSHLQTASVYMLYQNALVIGNQVYAVPEWFFSLGFYPIAEVSTARWGDASAAVEPLSRENLQKALQNGRMVFIASHGGYPAGAISLSPISPDYFSPMDVKGVGTNLQFVYVAGCDAGDLKTEWEKSFSPAQVVTFDRISWIQEHVYWLWFIGPDVVSGLR